MAATSLQRVYGPLLSTTLDAFRPRLADQIFKSNPLLYYLLSDGKMGRAVRREEGAGEKIRVPVIWQENQTAGSIDGYETVDVTPQNEITSVFEDWKESSGSVSISQKQINQNKGVKRLLNLLDERTNIAMMSVKQDVNRQLVQGTITSNIFGAGNSGKDMLPLARLIGHLGTAGGSNAAATPGTSVHSVNPESQTWWKNQWNTLAAPTSYDTLDRAMAKVYSDCSKGGQNDHVDFILCNQGTFLAYERSMFDQQRFGAYGTEKSPVSKAFQSLSYRTAWMFWDEYVPDTYTPNADAEANQGTMFFINTNWLKFVVEADSVFKTGDFRQPHNQHAMYALIYVMAQLTVEMRRKQGVLNNITHTMVS